MGNSSTVQQGTTGVNFHNFPSANMNFHHLRVPTGRAAAQRGHFLHVVHVRWARRSYWRYRCRSSDSFPAEPKTRIPTHMLEQTAGRSLMEPKQKFMQYAASQPAFHSDLTEM